MTSTLSRSHSFMVVWVSYLSALFIAGLTLHYLADSNIYFRLLIADLVATLVIFVGSVLYKNASIYDPYWSVLPVAMAIYLVLHDAPAEVNDIRQFLVTFCVMFWGIRLTYNWASQWTGMNHEDWRYRDLRKKTGKWFWLVNLTGIQLFPTMLVYLGCLSLVPSLSISPTSLNWLDALGCAIAISAILLEATADLQLRRFRNRNKNPQAILKSGLWKHLRHPNYAGEMLFWWGIYCFALATGPQYWWMIIGPISITALFFFISVPMIDRKMISKRPAYRDHIKTTSGLIPGLKF